MSYRPAQYLLSAVLIATSAASPYAETTTQNDTAPTCLGIEGNADIYGLGIRLGVYLEAVSSGIAFFFAQPSFDGLLLGNITLQLAMFVGLSYATISEPELQAVEAHLITMLILCMLSNVPLGALTAVPPSGQSKYILAFLLVLLTGFFAYMVWLWFKGLDVLEHTPCTQSAFFFVKVDLYGRFRTLMKVFTTTMLLTASDLSLIAIFLSLEGNDRIEVQAPISCSTCGHMERSEFISMQYSLINSTISLLGDPSRVARTLVARSLFVHSLSAILYFGLLALLVAEVECTIRWNHISGVVSVATAGQLIPFTMAIVGMVNVVMDWKPSGYGVILSHMVRRYGVILKEFSHRVRRRLAL